MATLSRLTYEFPPIDCVPGPCSSIPTEFSELGFDRISYYNYFHNGLIDGWAFIVEGKDLAACFDHMTNSGPRLDRGSSKSLDSDSIMTSKESSPAILTRRLVTMSSPMQLTSPTSLGSRLAD
jgi:hypothetical protein